MEIFLFLESYWWVLAGISLIILISWVVFSSILYIVNPSYEPTNLGSEEFIDHDIFRIYHKELIELGFQHYGDFNIKYQENPAVILFKPFISKAIQGGQPIADMGQKQTESVFFNPDRTIIACISKNPDRQRPLIEFSTYFDDGTQLYSRNCTKIRSMEGQPPPTVTIMYYPKCRTADLLDFHKIGIKKFGNLSRTHPAPTDIMEKRVEDTGKRLEYNCENGRLKKDKSGKYYKLDYSAIFKSIGRAPKTLLAKIISPRPEKTYRTGFQEPGDRELSRIKTTTRVLFGLYFLFPISACVYKYFFMLPDPFAYLGIAVSTLFTALGYSFFLCPRPTKKVLFLEIVYFVFTGLFTYTGLWTSGLNLFLVFLTFLLGIMGASYAMGKKKELRKEISVPIASVILIAMCFILIGSFRSVAFIHSFRHLEAEEVKNIFIYKYEKMDSFSFSEAEPEVEIKERALILEFCSSLGDTTPYNRESGIMKGEYVVRIEKQDGGSMFFLLTKGNGADKNIASIGFIPLKHLENKENIFYPEREEYQSKKLYKFLEKDFWEKTIK